VILPDIQIWNRKYIRLLQSANLLPAFGLDGQGVGTAKLRVVAIVWYEPRSVSVFDQVG
jgi:hypothetical protein